ncbi:hypothetical protein [Methylobacterium radiotolerans]|uniref:hypothetical protein n=1 Tax=Methylobacterium radiotolerans TaxID=31998 RepID=UPI001057AA91
MRTDVGEISDDMEKRLGVAPAAGSIVGIGVTLLLQEQEDALLGGSGQRQGQHAHRLAGRQRLRVRRIPAQLGVCRVI